MAIYTVKICDPEGKRDQDMCVGVFETTERAASWAHANVPSHITWHVHACIPVDSYDRAYWESRVPDYITSLLR